MKMKIDLPAIGMISTKIIIIITTKRMRIMYGKGDDTICLTFSIILSLSIARRRLGLIGLATIFLAGLTIIFC